MLSLVARLAARRCILSACTRQPTTSAWVGRPILHMRLASSAAEIFSLNNPELLNATDIPALPIPPLPRPSIEELTSAGESVLDELGLFSWWKPTGYFRWGIEAMHNYFDLPYWTTIMCATIALRLALIFVPIASQRLVAKQSRYKKELDEFRIRILEAKKEGNALLQQQIFLEQMDFMKKKDIRLGRQFLVLLANGAVFGTQFFAIREMVRVGFPGFSTGGILWFHDLTLQDPYLLLPLISAVTMAVVVRVGIETGASPDQMTPAMRVGMQYGLPVMVFIFSSRFASALCLYWSTSNMVSLIYAGLFRVPAVRGFLNLPAVIKHDPKAGGNSIGVIIKNWKEQRARPPTIAEVRREDAQRFKKAGRGKPIVRS